MHKKDRLEDGSSGDDLRTAVLSVTFESCREHAGELDALCLEVSLRGPGLDGVEELSGYGVHVLRDLEVEDGEVFELGLGEGSVVNGIDDSPGVLEGASLSSSELSSSPSGVDEPALGTTGSHSLSKHGGVSRRVENDEGLSETSGESGRGLGDSILGSGGLRGVTGKEPVLRLFGV